MQSNRLVCCEAVLLVAPRTNYTCESKAVYESSPYFKPFRNAERRRGKWVTFGTPKSLSFCPRSSSGFESWVITSRPTFKPIEVGCVVKLQIILHETASQTSSKKMHKIRETKQQQQNSPSDFQSTSCYDK